MEGAGEKQKVFVSYRRSTSWPLARLVFTDLRMHGYDTFMDFEGLGSGDFGRVILGEIAAREHFVLVLQPSALDRVVATDDWLRREITHALATRRNIVPVLADGFRFESERALPADIAPLRRLNAVTVPTDYFDAAMTKLRLFLTVRTPVVVATPGPRPESGRRVPSAPPTAVPSPRPDVGSTPDPDARRQGRARRASATGRLGSEPSRVPGAPAGTRLLGTLPLPDAATGVPPSPERRTARASATGRLGRAPSRAPGAPAGARLLGVVPLPPGRPAPHLLDAVGSTRVRRPRAADG